MIVEGGEITEKNPMSKMVTGPVLNVKTTILLGAINAIAAMPLRAMQVATVVHVVIIVVATEEVVGSVETIGVATEEAVDSVETIGVVTEEAVDNVEIIGVVTAEMEDSVETIVVVTEEAVDNVEIIGVVTAEMEVSAGMTEAEDARMIVNNDRVMTGHRAENTKVAMIANQSDGTHVDPAGGARKARVETVGAEISRGVFI